MLDTSRTYCLANGSTHHVFKLMGLVENDNIMLGKQRAVGGDIQTVYMRVHDNDIGNRC